jgi:hypothetical protein
MSLRHRIERLEREYFPDGMTILELEFICWFEKKYKQDLESAPGFLLYEYERIHQLWERSRSVTCL